MRDSRSAQSSKHINENEGANLGNKTSLDRDVTRGITSSRIIRPLRVKPTGRCVSRRLKSLTGSARDGIKSTTHLDSAPSLSMGLNALIICSRVVERSIIMNL